MTAQMIIGTLAGAFIFPFFICMAWGRLVDDFGPAGGWLAAGFIVGTCWALNHGVGLIYQSGPAWIDMAWAAGIGILVNGLVSGANFGKTFPSIINAILGGILGGFILACLFTYNPPW